MKKWVVYLSICCLAYACQQNPESSVALLPPEVGDLTCTADKTVLYEDFSFRSRPLEDLAKGTPIWDEQDVSPFLMPMERAGKTIYEPWLKVRTAEAQTGWVYADNVRPTTADSDTVWRQNKHMKALFGESLTTDIHSYQKDFQSVERLDDFVAVYRKGQELTDTLLYCIEQRLPAEGRWPLPDFFWLENWLPGYEMQVVAKGTAYQLFENYKDWLKLAQRTPAQDDDAYLAVCLNTYARDSIEYYYPGWFIQTWDYGGHSLLGRGIHCKVLVAMNQMAQSSGLFKEDLQGLKEQLLQDIMQSEEGYWEQAAPILVELDSILAMENAILTHADRIAVQTRRKMFENPAANGILTNLKSGSLPEMEQ